MIEFESVGKTFRDGTAAVKDLSLTIPSDKITVVVGPSGCGKTTTLRMVNRMLEPTSGKIVWDGVPLKSKRKTALRRQMGYVIQSGGLFPHRTVIDNIGTVPGLLGWGKDKTRKRSMELLENVGLDRKFAHRYPAQLSGGQQQRVGVARALAADPLVLLMDEPFSAVDPVVRSELHEFFLGLQREISKTIFLITHDIDEAIKLGDQVVILRVGGQLAQAGTPQQLLDEPADAFVEGFIGRDRGYRSLSFLPADHLQLDSVKVVREAETTTTGEPTLVVDGDAKPIGWADPHRPGQVYAVGSTFVPEQDTLRAALDAALTSPYGLAVAVAPGTGRFAGVVGADAILGQVSTARTAVAESISVRADESSTDAPAVATADEAFARPAVEESAPEAVTADAPEEQASEAEAEAADAGPGVAATEEPESEYVLVGDEAVDPTPSEPVAEPEPESAGVPESTGEPELAAEAEASAEEPAPETPVLSDEAAAAEAREAQR